MACHFVVACRGVIVWCCYVAVLLMSATAVAQEEPTPESMKSSLGYQWLHPGWHGASLRSRPSNAPLSQNMGDIPQGAGASFTYNFYTLPGTGSRLRRQQEQERTRTRFRLDPAWRAATKESTFFVHTLLGYNRLTVPDAGHQQWHWRAFSAAEWISISGVGSRCGCSKQTTCGHITIFPMTFRPPSRICGVPSRGRPAAHRFGV